MAFVKPIPEGYRTVTPSLVVPKATEAFNVYHMALGAEKVEWIEYQGMVMHGEIRIGDSIVMLADASPEWKLVSPHTLGGSPCSLYLYVEDIDGLHQRAIAAGFVETMPPSDMFWGDRFSQLIDPFGHNWSLATHVEDVDAAEIHRRMHEFANQTNN